MKVLTIKDVCAMFSISRPTVYVWMHKHGMPSYKVGDSLRFEEAELLEWFKGKK